MTATRGIVASLVVVTLVVVGVFVWQQTKSNCPDPFSAGGSYSSNDEVLFAGQVWRAKVSGSSEVPGPNATEWTSLGTC
ncbi:hypothetical protein KIH74_16915 [Kineosporia sp. J2-2]|uniref:Chitin-binding type-3 domain-containing protein n=1 Tax=Kineosporia corallincola TaxID=2835133 RepID=A0ABS5THT1_9ACTN|nr:hypothetical protein [Kineosporia corallincola]MBT0770627.1 hypothetical protein [Kineosporia corallincola]